MARIVAVGRRVREIRGHQGAPKTPFEATNTEESVAVRGLPNRNRHHIRRFVDRDYVDAAIVAVNGGHHVLSLSLLPRTRYVGQRFPHFIDEVCARQGDVEVVCIEVVRDRMEVAFVVYDHEAHSVFTCLGVAF